MGKLFLQKITQINTGMASEDTRHSEVIKRFLRQVAMRILTLLFDAGREVGVGARLFSYLDIELLFSNVDHGIQCIPRSFSHCNCFSSAAIFCCSSSVCWLGELVFWVSCSCCWCCKIVAFLFGASYEFPGV